MHDFVFCLKYRFNFSVTLLDEKKRKKKMHAIAADGHPCSTCAPKTKKTKARDIS